LEVEVVGWGAGLESWGITNKILVGDPSQPAVWEMLDNVLKAGYENANGERMYVAATLVDAGGHHTDDVYRFTASREWRNVFACQGRAGIGRPIASRPRKTDKSNAVGASVVTVGVDTAKDQLFDWLTKEQVCPGYCHFPRNKEYDSEFFAQITAEKRVKHYVRGALVWGYKKTRPRNEAIDKRNYARAALDTLGLDLNKMAENGYKFLRNVSEPVVRNSGRRILSGGVSV
jgi:phage terminase large subunit GpA-like protein